MRGVDVCSCTHVPQMRRNKADGVLSIRPLRYKMSIIENNSNANKVFKLLSRKTKEQTENTEIKVNIDIFYELFRITLDLIIIMVYKMVNINLKPENLEKTY